MSGKFVYYPSMPPGPQGEHGPQGIQGPRGPMGPSGAEFTTGNLVEPSTMYDVDVNCETLGAFKLLFSIIGQGVYPYGALKLRVNGSSSANLYFTCVFADNNAGTPIVTQSNYVIRQNGAISFGQGRDAELEVICEFPRIADSAARMIKVRSMSKIPTVAPQIIELSAQYEGTDEIASIGIEVVTGGDTLMTTATKYVLIRPGY